MSKSTISKKDSLKTIKEFCQNNGIKPIGNKSHKVSWIKGYTKWLNEQSSKLVYVKSPVKEVKYNDLINSQPLVFNKTGQIELVEKPVEVNTELEQLEKPVEVNCEIEELDYETKYKIIKELFKEIGSDLGFRVKVERKHDYPTFSKTRLTEHILYWYLDSQEEVKRSELNKLFNNTQRRNTYIDKFSKHPIMIKYLEWLF